MTEHAVYRIWEGETLLYVGVTKNWPKRLQAHFSQRGWDKKSVRFDIQIFENRKEAFRAERLAIASEGPVANRQDVSGDILRKAKGRAEALACWISKSGMTQYEFASLVGVSSSVISRVLANQARPPLAAAIAIEKLTDGAVTIATWGDYASPREEGIGNQEVQTILDALGHDKVAERLGIAKTRVRRAYDEERLPAVWYATLCDMTRKRLPFCLFTFKGQGHE